MEARSSGNPPGTAAQGGSTQYSSQVGGTASDSTRPAQSHYEQAKQSAADTYEHARHTLSDASREAQRAATQWSQQARSATETYVHEKPWNALGIAVGIGLLVALILRR